MIRTAQTSDTLQIQQLWEECFPDDSGFNPYFFARIFRTEHTVLLFHQDTLCAMLQRIPYMLRLETETVLATYIYGACTAIHARKKGYMAQLLNWSFARDQEEHRAASVLIPQEEWLFDFYAKYGYRTAFFTAGYNAALHPQTNASVVRCTAKDIPSLQQAYLEATAHHHLVLQRDMPQWHAQLELFDILGAGVYALFEQSRIRAYAFVWNTDQEVLAQELISLDKESEASLCADLAARFSDKPVRITTQGGEVPLGCVKFYRDNISLDGYMNLLYQ